MAANLYKVVIVVYYRVGSGIDSLEAIDAEFFRYENIIDIPNI